MPHLPHGAQLQASCLLQGNSQSDLKKGPIPNEVSEAKSTVLPIPPNEMQGTGIVTAYVRIYSTKRATPDALAGSSCVLCNSTLRSTVVFWSWTTQIVLEWLHQGCDGDLSADSLNFGAGDVYFH